MKRILVSISAAALGTAALQAAGSGLSPQEASKPWSLSLSLRGFYDDNYLTAPKGSAEIPDSFGAEIRPSIGLNLPMESTFVGLDYTFSGRYYEDSRRGDEPWDLSHIFNAALDHAFAPQHTVQVSDNFAIGQEPTLIEPDGATVFRTAGDNLRNRGEFTYSAGLSRRLGLQLGYQNTYVDYEQENEAAQNSFQPAISRSAILDRMEQVALANLRYQVTPNTVGFLGYNYGDVSYNGDEFIVLYPAPYGPQKSDLRDNRSHIGYLGAEHNFNRLMTLSVRGGVQAADFYNDPLTENDLSPYGDLSFNYAYLPGSQFSVGWSIFQSATDVLAQDATTGQVTQNRLANTVYANLAHQFFPSFFGTLFGQWQLSQYNGGAYDGQNDNYYALGLTFRYQFNRFLSADAGYTFDALRSDIPNRDYDRNRVFIGLTGTY